MSVRSSLGNPTTQPGNVGSVIIQGDLEPIVFPSGNFTIASITLGPGTWNIQINGVMCTTSSDCNLSQMDLQLRDPLTEINYMVTKEMPSNLGTPVVAELQLTFWRSVIVTISESIQFDLNALIQYTTGSLTISRPSSPPHKIFTVTKLV
tara:strand:- start:164 stop:613 length:450 start_codon:yes stop_codon:yes gene_type:complete